MIGTQTRLFTLGHAIPGLAFIPHITRCTFNQSVSMPASRSSIPIRISNPRFKSQFLCQINNQAGACPAIPASMQHHSPAAGIICGIFKTCRISCDGLYFLKFCHIRCDIFSKIGIKLFLVIFIGIILHLNSKILIIIPHRNAHDCRTIIIGNTCLRPLYFLGGPIATGIIPYGFPDRHQSIFRNLDCIIIIICTIRQTRYPIPQYPISRLPGHIHFDLKCLWMRPILRNGNLSI